MSTTTHAIDIVDQLVEAKIPKETAKELIDFVESQRGDLLTKQDIKDMATKQDIAAVKQEIAVLKQGQQWLKWIASAIIALMLGGFTFLNARIETTRMELKTEMNQRFTKVETDIKELKSDIKELKSDMQEIKGLLQKGRR